MTARGKSGKWPMPETIPGVIRCRGGWFAVKTVEDSCGSGPWATEEAALAAMRGDYIEANRLDRAAR